MLMDHHQIVRTLLEKLDPGPHAFLNNNNRAMPQVIPAIHAESFRQSVRFILAERKFSLEMHEDWKKYQFKTLIQGRGPAVVAAVGNEYALEMWKLTGEYSEKYMENGFSTDVMRKGPRQAYADMLALAIIPDEEGWRKAFANLNRRVVGGYIHLWTHKHLSAHLPDNLKPALLALLEGQGWQAPDSEFASAPAGSMSLAASLLGLMEE